MVNMRLKICGRQKVIVRHHELNADKESFRASHEKKEDGHHHVHQAQLLVVDRNHPVVQDVEQQIMALARRGQIQSAVNGKGLVRHRSLYFNVSR